MTSTHAEAEPVSETLRERKKARTRAALIEVSQRMFAERGYHVTTLEEICGEVEVRPQTLLRYFESKAHLAVAPWSDQVMFLRHWLERPERTASTIDVWREFVRVEAVEVMEPSSSVVGNMITNHAAFTAWADKDPFLVAMNSDIERQTEAVLIDALVVDLGLERGDLHCTLLASMLVVGRRAVFDRWSTSADRSARLLDDQLAVIDYAVTSLPRQAARRLLAISP
jgi:AcrR family transcriptional regulator